MKFMKDQIQFKNTDTQQEYELQTKNLERHGVYLAREEVALASVYSIKL